MVRRLRRTSRWLRRRSRRGTGSSSRVTSFPQSWSRSHHAQIAPSGAAAATNVAMVAPTIPTRNRVFFTGYLLPPRSWSRSHHAQIAAAVVLRLRRTSRWLRRRSRRGTGSSSRVTSFPQELVQITSRSDRASGAAAATNVAMVAPTIPTRNRVFFTGYLLPPKLVMVSLWSERRNRCGSCDERRDGCADDSDAEQGLLHVSPPSPKLVSRANLPPLRAWGGHRSVLALACRSSATASMSSPAMRSRGGCSSTGARPGDACGQVADARWRSPSMPRAASAPSNARISVGCLVSPRRWRDALPVRWSRPARVRRREARRSWWPSERRVISEPGLNR